MSTVRAPASSAAWAARTRPLNVQNPVPGKKIDWPHLINDNEIMLIGSARPLTDALRLACVDMVNWLVSDYGFEKYDAVQLLGQAAHIYVANVVDPQFTVGCALNKKYLPQ
jgi:amidase